MRRIPLPVILVLVALIASPAAAMEEPKDRLDQEINKLQVYLHNALVKVKNETIAMGAAPRGPLAQERDARMAPAGRCCESNIMAVADATGKLREMFQNLRSRFRESEKRAGVASVRAMGFHLDDMEGRVRQFAGTGEKEFAIKFLELAINAVNSLREEKLDLEACCADLLPPLEVPEKGQQS